MFNRNKRITAIPEVRNDVNSIADTARALKQTVEVLTRQAGNEGDWAVTVSELQSYVNNAIANQNPLDLLTDSVLNGILDRAAKTADKLAQQVRDEAYIGLAKFQTALDNFINGYDDTNAIVNGKIARLEASVGDNEAKIISEQLTRATATQSLAGRIDTVNAQVRGNIAAVTTDILALADVDTALAARIDNVTTASTGATTYVQSTTPKSLATNDYWVDLTTGTPIVKQWTGTAFATRTATINSIAPTTPAANDLWFDTNTGLLKQYISSTWTTQSAFVQSRTPTVVATGAIWVDTALANTIKQWNGTAWVAIDKSDYLLGYLLSSVTTESISKTDADRTIGARFTSLISVAPDGNSAYINGQQLTTATRTSALADDLTALGVQTTGGSAGGFYRLIASATPGDGAAAEFNVQVRATEATGSTGYASAGMRIQAFSTGQSRVKFNADQFIISNSTNSVTPFVVISGLQSVNAAVDANAVTWGSSQFVAVGSSGSVATSPDGDTWTLKTGLSGTTWGTTAARCVLWTGSQFIVGGDSARIATSPDAATWTYRTGLSGTAWGAQVVRGLATNGTTIVAVGDAGRVATTTDGITWTNSTSLSAGTWGATTVVRAVNWNGTRFLAVGDAGKVATSTNGSTWTYQGGLVTAWGAVNARAIAWNGTTYVVVGDSGKVATSTDGATWANQTGLASTTWGTSIAYAVVWSGTQFVVLGDTGKVATSPDGVTWTYQSSLSSTTWATGNGFALAVNTSNTIVSAVGQAGRSASSPTGVTWYVRDGALAAQVVVPATNLSGSLDAKTQIQNLGLMSYINQITAANAAAFIGTAAIGSAFIADASILTAKINDAAITNAKINDGAITTAKIGDAQITTAKIGSLAVKSAQIDDLTVGNEKITAAAVSRTVYASANTGAFISAGVGITNYQVDARATLTTRQDTNGVKSRVFISTWSNGFAVTGDVSVYYAKMQVWSEAGGVSTLLAEVPLTTYTALGETGSGTYYVYTKGANATSFQVGISNPPIGSFPILVRIEIQTIIASTSFFATLPQVNFQAWELSK